MTIRQQVVCVICVYGPQAGNTETEKEASREEVERLAGLSDGQTMLCVAAISMRTSVWLSRGRGKHRKIWMGTRIREGQELLEILRRNWLAVAGTFFQKKESHTITYRSGWHKTDVDLLVVRQQQLRRVKDFNKI